MSMTACGSSDAWKDSVDEAALRIPAAYGSAEWQPFGDPTMDVEPVSGVENFTKTEIRSENGRSRLYIDGESVVPVAYFDLKTVNVGNGLQTMANTEGVVDLVLSDSIVTYGDNIRVEAVRTAMQDILYENPDAYIIWRNTPIGSNAFHGLDDSESLKLTNGETRTSPSIASDGWIEDMKVKLVELIEMFANDEMLRERVIGFAPLAGCTGEWFAPDFWEGVMDVSEPNLRKFREWLTYRYKTDEALQAAWGDDTVTLETVELPEKVPGYVRTTETHNSFLLEADEQQFVDYVLYWNDLTVFRIQQMASIYKQATANSGITIFFYGYYSELFGAASGHFNMGALLDSPYLDAFSGPVSYDDRNEGGVGTSMTATAAITAAGKMWFDESDYRTPLSDAADKIKTTEGWIEVTRRELGKLMMEGNGTWWMGFFESEEFWEETASLEALYAKYDAIAPKSEYDVAFVIDEQGMALSGRPYTHNSPLLRQNRQRWTQAGINHNFYLLEDFIEGRIDADLVFVLSCYSLTVEETEKLAREAHRDGRTTVWMNGFGELTSEQVNYLTGMELQEVIANWLLTVNFNDNEATGFAGGALEPLNTDALLEPLYQPVKADDLEILATYEDDGSVAVAAKTIGKSTQVYYSEVVLTPEIIRSFADMAGIKNGMTTGDVYYGNGSLCVIHSKTAGEKRVYFEEATDVYCYFSNTWYENVTEVTLTMEEAKTEFLFLGDKTALTDAGIG